MIYQSIASIIDKGGRVCLASPRVDVCIEVYKRLQRDFSCEISLLHAGSEDDHYSPLVVATSHQLMKFYHAFDLVILDEVDAFPFVGNPALEFALKKSLKKDGVLFYLTATSTPALDASVKKGELRQLSLLRRFHNHPLVLPKWRFMKSTANKETIRQLDRKLVKVIREQRETKIPLLIFVPEIQLSEKLIPVLETYCPKDKIVGVSSQSQSRKEIVEDFRQEKIDILVTTTILERGVTFPKVDVIVLEADHHLFNASSLIQIAGRVGRSLERPSGLLLYFSEGKNKEVCQAIRTIRRINQKAGYDELSSMPRMD
ncbi:ComF operon protein A, DNA transporter ATPase [Streptococcus sp. DD13]|nr:ComF operon protein A, DNA transporter ATPase [Streptococcus sp. DD13]